jgi:uncharacterized protein (DUF924 family)
MPAHPSDIVGFWRNAGPDRWFARDAAFDAAIRLKFEPVLLAGARGEYDPWAESAEGALALVILFDQFPRNIYRGSAHAFATDPLARKVANEAIERGFDEAVDPDLRPFFYMPFHHSEDLAEQDRAVGLIASMTWETGDSSFLSWAEGHRAIIERFGRFPHRNRALGRTSTPEEEAFLSQGGFKG